jgi:hypothetical protein
MSNPRRPPGLSTFSSSRLQSHHYTSHGATLRTRHATSLSTQLSVFQSLLHNFALTHAKEIRANPAFRAEFARMCLRICLDPRRRQRFHKGLRSPQRPDVELGWPPRSKHDRLLLQSRHPHRRGVP